MGTRRGCVVKFPRRIVKCPRCGTRCDADSDVLIFLGLGILLGVLLASMICQPAHAQERKAFTVPIERKAGLILVSAKVQGIDGTFILDTGAQWTVVSPRLARSATERRPTDARGVTGTTHAELARVMLVLGGEN